VTTGKTHAGRGRTLGAILSERRVGESGLIAVALQIADLIDSKHRAGSVQGPFTVDDVVVYSEQPVAATVAGPSPAAEVLPPECRDGSSPDFRSDVWSFGRFLETLDCAALEDVARACLHDNPSERLSIDEVKSRLAAFSGEATRVTADETQVIAGETQFIRYAPAALPEQPAFDPTGRYTDLGVLGAGGMGEVRRVLDNRLNRVLAMKIIRPERILLHERFVEEAQITAQLQHPAIIPVHDLGTLPDGRLFFTMKEVKGRTLTRLFAEDNQTLRQLVAVLQRAAEGVGYAHARGVLHRDLKPSNIMAGAYGEVLVLDWGLTKLNEVPAGMPSIASADELIITHTTRSGEARTEYGVVLGTPRFMSPEQAMGQLDSMTPRSDVYSLGCVLYNMLTGESPYAHEVTPVLAVRRKDPKPIPHRLGGKLTGAVPAELRDICNRAMARTAAERFANGTEFAQALSNWLDGAQKREQAMRVLEEARAVKPRIAELRGQASELDAQALGILRTIPPFMGVDAKKGAWAMQDQANQLRNQAEALDAEFTHKVHASLSVYSDLEPAHAALAEHYKERHARAEDAGDTVAAIRYETLLRIHDDGTFAAWLSGDGAVTVHTDPAGARALLYRYVERDRRLVPEFVEDLGVTPIRERKLPLGSYVIHLQAEGRVEVRYPVFIRRLEHWDGVQPGAAGPAPIYLPAESEIPKDHCYIPAGWFQSGGDPGATHALPGRRLWLDGFVTPRFPVTMANYLAYLNHLSAEAAEAALPVLPEWEDRAKPDEREYGYSRNAEGVWAFDGPEERLTWPVTLLTWAQCKAYADWLARTTGESWHLIHEMEHEKASRGVDGRRYPWGNFLDPTFCLMRDTHHERGRALRCSVLLYPIDESPYGVRGCAGNVHNWCEDAYSPTGPTIIDGIPIPPDPNKLRGPGGGGAHRIVKGGSWRDGDSYCRTAFRDCPPAIFRCNSIGFQVARFLP
jgi:serine/threonine-protein kinase